MIATKSVPINPTRPPTASSTHVCDIQEQLLHIFVKRFRAGRVCKAHRLFYQSTLGSRVATKKRRRSMCQQRYHALPLHTVANGSSPGTALPPSFVPREFPNTATDIPWTFLDTRLSLLTVSESSPQPASTLGIQTCVNSLRSFNTGLYPQSAQSLRSSYTGMYPQINTHLSPLTSPGPSISDGACVLVLQSLHDRASWWHVVCNPQ